MENEKQQWVNANQGDVCIVRLSKLPEGLIAETCNEKIVAYGEVTGHKHLLRPVKGGVEFFNGNGLVYAQVEKEAELVHEEHETIIFPKGVYALGIQEEFDILEGVRAVSD